MDKIKNSSITIYQLFRREFIEPKSSYLEWAFTYLLKCFYFPKYLRPEYLKWTENHAEKELWEELTGGKFDKEERLIFTDKDKEKKWEKISDADRDFLTGKFSNDFIKYALSFTPYEDKNFNIPTDEQVNQLYKAFQLIPTEWKEKQPWYPYSTCDLALDDGLTTIKWTNKTKIDQEEIKELVTNYFDYDLPSIKGLKIYFAKEGKWLTTKIWGRCPSDITIEDFKAEKLGRLVDWREQTEKNSEPKKVINLLEKLRLGETTKLFPPSTENFIDKIEYSRADRQKA